MKMDYGLATVREIEQMMASISVPAHRFERIYLGFLAPISDGGVFASSRCLKAARGNL
jgi:hypothetical protein